MKIKKGDKLIITDQNSEHPFKLDEIVKVIDILPNTLLYVKSVERKQDGYIVKGEYSKT